MVAETRDQSASSGRLLQDAYILGGIGICSAFLEELLELADLDGACIAQCEDGKSADRSVN